MLLIRISIAVFAFVSYIIAEELAGDLPRYISSDKSPYYVIADIYVPSGKTVEIEAGTVFLFKNFTGLHVLGVLNARGTMLKSIVFTSVNDNQYNGNSNLNPTPYDWNGIYIHKDGIGTDLEKIKVCYSVKGVISETKFIRISDASFHENGRANLTIENEMKPVTPDMPFSHNLSMKDAVVDGVPVKILMDPHGRARNITRVAGVILMLGGGTVAGYYTNETKKDLEDFEKKSIRLTPNSTYEEKVYLSRDSSVWVKARDEKNTSIRRMVTGYTTFLLGLVALTVSFTF